MKNHIGCGGDDDILRDSQVQGHSILKSQGSSYRQLGGEGIQFPEVTFIKRGVGVSLNLKSKPAKRAPSHPQASEPHPMALLIPQDLAVGHSHDPCRSIQG